MSISVSEFIKENEKEIKTLYGFEALLRDLGVVGKKKAFSISNDMIAKKLLSNDYGHACDERLCHLFKKYARANMTFEGIDER